MLQLQLNQGAETRILNKLIHSHKYVMKGVRSHFFINNKAHWLLEGRGEQIILYDHEPGLGCSTFALHQSPAFVRLWRPRNCVNNCIEQHTHKYAFWVTSRAVDLLPRSYFYILHLENICMASQER